MKMTNKSTTTLMDFLATVAISANIPLLQIDKDILSTEEWIETMEERLENEMTDKPVEIFTN